MKYLLLFTIIFCSCDNLLEYHYCIDSRLQEHVDCFFIEAYKRGLVVPQENLIATIVNTPTKKPNSFEPGLHVKTYVGQRYIKFDQYVFETNSYYENEVMVFHELGHWIGKEHCDCPENTIMNSHPNFYMYVKHPEIRDSKIDELFNI